MKLTNWRTTTAGCLLALGQWAAGVSDPWWVWKAGQLCNIVGALLLGAAAGDAKKPAVPTP